MSTQPDERFKGLNLTLFKPELLLLTENGECVEIIHINDYTLGLDPEMDRWLADDGSPRLVNHGWTRTFVKQPIDVAPCNLATTAPTPIEAVLYDRYTKRLADAVVVPEGTPPYKDDSHPFELVNTGRMLQPGDVQRHVTEELEIVLGTVAVVLKPDGTYTCEGTFGG
jgi:hypothetical protein